MKEIMYFVYAYLERTNESIGFGLFDSLELAERHAACLLTDFCINIMNEELDGYDKYTGDIERHIHALCTNKGYTRKIYVPDKYRYNLSNAKNIVELYTRDTWTYDSPKIEYHCECVEFEKYYLF